jgi:hypothetical protein
MDYIDDALQASPYDRQAADPGFEDHDPEAFHVIPHRNIRHQEKVRAPQ